LEVLLEWPIGDLFFLEWKEPQTRMESNLTNEQADTVFRFVAGSGNEKAL